MNNQRLLLAISSIIFCLLVIFSIIVYQNKIFVNKNKIFAPLSFITPHPSPTPTLPPNKPIDINTVLEYIGLPEDRQIDIDPKNDIVLLATGDVIPARSVNNKMITLNNFRYPFEKTVYLLREPDITFINLESPLLPDCKPTSEGMSFCGSDKSIEGLVYAGVDVASIANNHAANYGIEGIQSTESLLKQHNILMTGNGHAAIKQVKNIKFGFLGYNDIEVPQVGISSADISTIKKQVAELKKKVNYVVVTFHWGIEYQHDPDQRQVELAHTAIDAGADLIIGNHPHWVQGLEVYKDKLITYAHGNFVFDQMWSRETTEGVMGMYIFNSLGLKDAHFYPIVIEDYAQPRFASELEAKKILNDMRYNSR